MITLNAIAALVTIASLIATYLNIGKRRACFAIWTVTNAAWAIIDAIAGVLPQAALHLVYVVLAVHGYRAWAPSSSTPPEAPP